MTPEELKREDEFLEAQAKAIREHIAQKGVKIVPFVNDLVFFANDQEKDA